MSQDPTREEMLAYLATLPFQEEYDDFDRESAIYWFANDWHGGQDSNLYLALCNSPYNPGRCRGPESGSSEEMLYEELESHFAASAP